MIKNASIFFGIAFLFSVVVHAETLQTDAATIYYEVQGKGEAIVLLHGGFGDSRMWNGQFAAFAEKYRVIRYDQPGFGQSSKPEAAYSPVSVLLQLLEHLSVEKVTLIGNSMGGSLAIDFALLHPERVAGLVLVASSLNGYPVPQEDREKMNAVFSAAAQKGLPAAVELWLTDPMVAVAMGNAASADLLQRMVRNNSSIFLMRFWPIEKVTPSSHTRLMEIKAPTLVVVGDLDTPLILDMADAASSGISGAKKMILKGTDHLPQMEKAAEFNQAVLEFLETAKIQKQ